MSHTPAVYYKAFCVSKKSSSIPFDGKGCNTSLFLRVAGELSMQCAHLFIGRSVASSLRMDLPSISAGISTPAISSKVGARSMFNTMWGFLPRHSNTSHIDFDWMWLSSCQFSSYKRHASPENPHLFEIFQNLQHWNPQMYMCLLESYLIIQHKKVHKHEMQEKTTAVSKVSCMFSLWLPNLNEMTI